MNQRLQLKTGLGPATCLKEVTYLRAASPMSPCRTARHRIMLANNAQVSTHAMESCILAVHLGAFASKVTKRGYSLFLQETANEALQTATLKPLQGPVFPVLGGFTVMTVLVAVLITILKQLRSLYVGSKYSYS